jgi:GR25 family glycosyltransferase involved in LPS biosynthesis
VKFYIQAVSDRLPFITQCIIPSINSQGFKDIHVSVDHERKGPLYGATQIWKKIIEQDDRAIILQDDVILHKNFSQSLKEINEHIDAGVMQAVSLFAPPRKIMLESFEKGHNFIENYDFLWLQGVIFTKEFCKGLIKYAETQNTIHDDSVVRDYASSNGIPIWNCLPSLIQHDLNIKSTLGTPTSTGGRLRMSSVWQKNIEQGHFKNINSYKNGKPKCK